MNKPQVVKPRKVMLPRTDEAHGVWEQCDLGGSTELKG